MTDLNFDHCSWKVLESVSISFAIQSGEIAEILEARVDEWKEKLLTLIRDCNLKDVDETELLLETPMAKLYFIKERNAVVVRRLSCS